MRPACDSIFTQLTSKSQKYLNNHMQRHKYISLAIRNMLGMSNEI